MRASRERVRPRVEGNRGEDLPQLIAKSVAFNEEHIGRGAQPFITREKESALAPRRSQACVTAELAIIFDVRAEDAEPAGEPREHPVGGELGSFIHYRGRL